MTTYLLFSPREDEYVCTFIYNKEDKMIISYSLDEEYIVRVEEEKIKDFKQLEANYPAKSKPKKGKSPENIPVLIKKDYQDIKQALYFLGGTLEDYQQNMPAHKKLPQVINPFDMDVDETILKESEVDLNFDKELDESDLFDDLDSNEDDDQFDDYEDDYYR